jgi:hypothetical protein
MIYRRFSGLRLMGGVRVGRGRRRRWRWLFMSAVPGMLRGSRHRGEQAGKARRQKESGLHW